MGLAALHRSCSRRAGMKPYAISRQAITNPNWDPYTLNNDITLLKLSSPAQLGRRVSPVCLPPANLALPTNLQCVTTGWGRTNTNCTYATASGRAAGSRHPSWGLCRVPGCPGGRGLTPHVHVGRLGQLSHPVWAPTSAHTRVGASMGASVCSGGGWVQTPGITVHRHKLALAQGCLHKTISPQGRKGTLARRGKVLCVAAPIFGSTSRSLPRVPMHSQRSQETGRHQGDVMMLLSPSPSLGSAPAAGNRALDLPEPVHAVLGQPD